MRDYKVLIFDWDGTLADSIARIVDAMHLAALACGLAPCSDEATKGIIGLGLPEAIQVLHPELHESERLADFQRFYSEHYLAFEAQPSALFPDVRESLKEFRDQGYRLAVATGKSRRGLARVLAEHGWLDYFDITRCADETASKPDPMMLQEILAYCQVAPHEALMVGDSIFDLQIGVLASIAWQSAMVRSR